MQQERVVLDRGERDKARPGILPLGLKGPRGKVQSATGQWYGETTSRKGQDRGTSARDAPKRRGGSRGQSCK